MTEPGPDPQPLSTPSGGLGGTSGSTPTMLRSIRVIYAALVLGVAGFIVVVAVLIATASEKPDSSMSTSIIVVVVAAVILLAGPRIVPKLTGADEASLARNFQSRLIISMALVEGPVLLVIVAAFLSYEWWVLAVAIAYAVIGFVPLAPSRRNLERHEDQLRDQGIPFSLIGALERPLPRAGS